MMTSPSPSPNPNRDGTGSRRPSTLSRLLGARSAPPPMADHPDVARLNSITAQVFDIRNRYQAEWESRRKAILADTSLSLAGQDAALQRLQAELGDQYTAELDRLGLAATNTMAVLHQDEADARPGPEFGVEAQLARQAKRGDAERMFNAGIGFDRQIALAQDAETCWALTEEIPILMRLTGVTDDSLSQPYVWAAIRRIHELEGTLEAFDAARAGERIIAGLSETFDLNRAIVVGRVPRGGGLNAAIAAQLAVQEMTARQRGLQPNVYGEL